MDFFRFSVRLMVGGSIFIHTIAHLAMSHYRKRYQVTPQILHDLDTSKPLRQSRHNKSILSQNSVWQFLGFFFLIVTILLAFGSAKGKKYDFIYLSGILNNYVAPILSRKDNGDLKRFNLKGVTLQLGKQ